MGEQLVVESVSPREVTIRFADGESVRRNRFWLRDNCPSNGDRASLFREFSAATMPDDLTIVRAEAVGDEIEVEFDDGVVDRFDRDALLGSVVPVGAPDALETWRAGFVPTTFAFDEIGDGSPGHHLLLEALVRDGVAVVTGLPDERATEQVAAWLGPIRETDFGRVFDIATEPDPFTPSQSEAALDPHTDDPYRYSPAGVSVLHCVSPCDGEGGASTLVDGFAVAEAIATEEPDLFEALTAVAVPYVHRRDESVEQGAAVHLRAEAPIVSIDGDGRVCGIRFHERSMAPLTTDADDAERWYPALMRFARDVRSDGFTYRRRLSAGEAIVYDNQRVLHGRTAIDAARSRRHLRLCTIDRDQVHSRLRRLRERYAPGTESLRLPAGNLA